MNTYTIIKKSESVQHCLEIPPEFTNMDLEITIRPIRKQGQFGQRIESVYKRNESMNPFKSISDPSQWQRDVRSDWR